MTPDLAMDLLRAHLAASLLILLVLAARRPLRRLVGPRVAYALWLLPLIGAAAVLLPPRIDYAAAPAAAPAAQIAASQLFPVAEPGPAPAPAVQTVPAIDLWQAVLGLWLLGAAASLAWLVLQQARCLTLVRLGAVGPAVVGFWRPRMVLPLDFEERYSPDERALIVAHEAAHLKRQDARVIGLAVTLRSLAWFNPLAYIAVQKLRIDQELACDETVVTRFPRARRAYAGALAKSQLAIRPLPLGCYWPTGTEHPLLERLAMLKTHKTGAAARLAGACALGVLAIACGLGAWAAIPAEVRYLPAVEAPAEPEAIAAPEAVAAEPAEPAIAAEEAPEAAPEASAAAEAPEPQAAQPAPPLPDVFNGFSDTNLNQPVTVTGVIDRVEWINPITYISVRDPATGQVRKVGSGTPNSLMRQGGSREGLAAGTPISVDGYASSSGEYVMANPVGITSNGKPLFPGAADVYAQRAPALQRLRVCGVSPAVGPNATPEGRAAAPEWDRACDAKIAAAGAPGAVVERSFLTNSVIRQGDQPKP